jgi:hypothetical protein
VEAFGHRQKRTRGNLRLARCRGLGVLLGDRRADRRQTAPQQLLGDGTLLDRELSQHRIAVRAARTDALRAGPFRHRIRTWASGTVASITAFRAIPSVLATSAPSSVTSSTVPVATATVAVTAAPRTVPVVIPTASAASTTALRGERGGHEWTIVSRSQELDALGLAASGLRGGDRHDLDPVDHELGLGPQHVTHRRTIGQERAVEVALRLAGPGRPPGPGAVITARRQFNLETAGHTGTLPVVGRGHETAVLHPAASRTAFSTTSLSAG